ncbi:MAG: hypothetical protein HC808_19725 [Candidatus Competibacteraceae bacterium]|nr:hypothetical protein [Candidatus Competibacteraceae bacterium]
MPNTIPKIMEYLYALDARFQTSLDDDTQQIPLIDGIIADTETEIQFEQCLEKLKVPLREALFIHHGLDERPAFLREEDFRQHYGFGFETLRKNAATAAKLLSDCLLQ